MRDGELQTGNDRSETHNGGSRHEAKSGGGGLIAALFRASTNELALCPRLKQIYLQLGFGKGAPPMQFVTKKEAACTARSTSSGHRLFQSSPRVYVHVHRMDTLFFRPLCLADGPACSTR